MSEDETGAKGFSKKYWDENYSKPKEMDGIANAKEHVEYMDLVFRLDFIDIGSIVDFGFGTGHLFKQALKHFIPFKALGIEPSKYVFDKADPKNLKPCASANIKLENIDLKTWALKQGVRSKVYDLGICTSVLQYLNNEELEVCLPIMAQKVKYLYLTVPTDKELDAQIEDLEFHDTYANRRSRSAYQKILKKHFTFISSRILESKVHFDESSTSFTDLLYRF
jgi:hypothetical protein